MSPPDHGLWAEKIFSLYPESKFVYIVRNPFHCIHSRTKYFVPDTDDLIGVLADQWSYNIGKIEKFSFIHNDSCFILRYEDLVKDTERSIEKICYFLNLEFIPSRLKCYKEKASSIIKPFEYWKEDVRKNKIYVRNIEPKKLFSFRDIIKIQTLVFKYMKEYEYEIEFPILQRIHLLMKNFFLSVEGMFLNQNVTPNVSQDTTSVLILYPWGIESVRKKNIGAGLRVGLLADFLLEKGFHVTVLSTGRSSWETEDRGVLFRQIKFPSSFALFPLYALALLVSRIGRIPALQAFTYFSFPGFDRKFSARLKDIAGEHDVVLLEYPFWFEALGSVGKRLILTNHDVLAVSWTKKGPSFVNELMFGKLLKRELAAMTSAHSSVVVSDSDAEYFRARGVQKIRVITNPVALQGEKSVSSARGNNELEKMLEEFESAALFVGSGWMPNCEAARSIVDEIAPACPNIIFFIAGDCGKGIRCSAPNIRLLGAVEPSVLESLYQIVKFCLIPVPWGTGTSLKAVEAMSRGKVIIATRIGVRGIPFEHGIHGIVCDDVRDYPVLMKTLMADPEKCSQMACRAKQIAKKFDYRHVYGTYLELIDGLLNGK